MNTKQELLDNGSVAHQQALVEKLLGTGPRTVKRIIPGGKTLLEQVDKVNMSNTVYNWLRGCGAFSEVKLSMAKAPESIPGIKVSKIVNFEVRDNKPIWERDVNGRRNLARQLAETLNTRRFIYIHVKPDGVYLAEDPSKKFGPTMVVTEAMAKLPEHKDLAVGTKIPSPEWEPYIEFVPTNKGKYTNINRPKV